MWVTLAKAAGAATWLGLRGDRVPLEDEIAVISPHLDDAVLSVGAAVSWASRHGARVAVVTVLAGDPHSSTVAGAWDSMAGFPTAGAAARARRDEDSRACAVLGAQPVWLPFSDQQYERGGSDDTIRAAVVGAAGSGSVLLPGFPLVHDDHRWLRGILDGAFAPDRVGVYAEQPYTALSEDSPGDAAWRPLRASLQDQRRKRSACLAYESQLRLLGPIIGTIFRYEVKRGGETAAWNDR